MLTDLGGGGGGGARTELNDVLDPDVGLELRLCFGPRTSEAGTLTVFSDLWNNFGDEFGGTAVVSNFGLGLDEFLGDDESEPLL